MDQAIAIVDEHRIRETAYHLWEKDGCPIGRDHLYWEMAKRIAAGAEFSIAAPALGPAPRKKRSPAKTKLRVQ